MLLLWLAFARLKQRNCLLTYLLTYLLFYVHLHSHWRCDIALHGVGIYTGIRRYTDLYYSSVVTSLRCIILNGG